MKEFLKAGTAVLLLACAPCARARQGQAAPQTKTPETAVRERRVEADAPRPEESSRAEESRPAAADDGVSDEVEALRAKAESAASPGERGRLRVALAEGLARAERRAEAVTLLREVTAEERFDPQLFYNAGNALARLGESEAAAEAYRKAVAQRHGNYARAQHNLGVVLTRLGRWEDAEAALTSALRLESFTYAEASYSLGRLYALRGEPAKASAEWERTLRLKPDHADAAVALARTLAESGESARALAVLDSFGRRVEHGGAAPPREVAVARGEIVAAANVEAMRRAAGKSPAGEAPARAGAESKAASAAALPDVTALLRSARASKSQQAAVVDRQSYALLLSARAARAEGRDEEAVALYRRALREGGGYLAPANMELGFALISMRRHEEAADALLAVVRKDGARYPLVLYHLGRIYEHTGRLAEAGEAFARASELAGEENPQFYVDLSRVREREGRTADALAAAEQYVRAMSRAGGAPDWARARVDALRKQAAEAPAAKQ